MEKRKIALSWPEGNINYIRALEKLDIPYIVLSPEEEINWKEILGIIFIGGEDIHPCYYNEKEEENLQINKTRDQWEFNLIKEAFERKIPILGICRGCQLINVFFGGSLYQDLKRYKEEGKISQIHWREEGEDSFHNIYIEKDTNLYKILGKEEIIVNSSHHQAIKRLGKNLKVSAKFIDNALEIIEGIEHENYPYLLGVQWHPERLNCEESDKILRSLISLASY
ncbi:MAG: gamma-glutamyl-gamma-aminobutyrate hydrolase family protein [Dictyoglomaceae bacterium]